MIVALYLIAFFLLIVIAQLTGIRRDIQKLPSASLVATAPALGPQGPLVHKILNEAGEVIDTVPHEHGITDAIKLALRTPGLAVHWGHSGQTERGQTGA